MTEENPETKHLYCVASFTAGGQGGGMVGIFEDLAEATKQITQNQSAHSVYEFYYRFVCIEKYYANCFQHPITVLGASEEIKWFEWECLEPFDQTQSGRYVECKVPEWAERIFGFAVKEKRESK